MIRLLRAELGRLASRRMTWVIALIALGLLGLLLYGTYQANAPLSAAEQQHAEEMYQRARTDFEQHGAEQRQQCLDAQAKERERTPDADFHCDTMEPKREHYGKPPPTFTRMWSIQEPGAIFLGFLALLLGGSWVAAEFTTGSMATWLTYEPRRSRVFATKMLAVGLTLVLGAVLATAILFGGVYAIARFHGVAIALDRNGWVDVLLGAGRMTAFPILTGLGGAALAFIARHTAAVSGIAIAAVVVDQWVAGQIQDKARWSLFNNVLAFVGGKWDFHYLKCAQDAAARYDCMPTTETVWFAQAAAVLGGLVAAGLIAAWWQFLRRDVT